jgi:virulence factor Mce-like protein
MKRIAISAILLLLVGGFVVIATGASSGSAQGTYKIELDNAFGLVNGENFKVAGVVAGTIQSISLDPKNLHAVVTVSVNQGGFGQFRSNATCDSSPQSLIGEYFINCDPGTSGKVLRAGSTIPVTHTLSTVPADLIDDIMRLPERERFTILINELGAGLSGQSGDLQAALDRAVPALTETDNLLHLLAEDSGTLKDLTSSSNTVITALANNSKQVQRFVVEAGNTAADTATQDGNLQKTFADLPGFLEQLRPEARCRHHGEHAGAREPERRLRTARHAVQGPARIRAFRDARDQGARDGVRHRPSSGNRRPADSRESQPLRRPYARARPEPRNRAQVARHAG